MTTTCPLVQSERETIEDCYPGICSLTLLDFAEIALYTVQKINRYPKSFGKTIENYFHLLYPDEIKAYLMRRTINEKSFGKSTAKHNQDKEWRALSVSPQAQQVREIRNLCKLFVEQQDGILQLISDKLDELDAGLSVSDAGDKEVPNGK